MLVTQLIESKVLVDLFRLTSLKLVLPSLKSLRAYSSLFGERTS